MKFIDILTLSTRMFKARTLRTILTILGMSVGIGAILFLVSLGYGLQKTLLEEITTSDSLLTLDVTENRSGETRLNKEALEKIKSFSGVDEISPALNLSAQGSFNNLTAELSAVALKSSYFRLSGIKIEKGRLPNDDKKEEIAVSSSVAQIFSKNADEMIGQEIALSFFIPKENESAEGSTGVKENSKDDFDKIESDKKFKITGVVGAEDNVVYVNLENFSDSKVTHFSQLKVKSRSDGEMNKVRGMIMAEDFLVSSISEVVDEVNRVFRVIKIVLMLFGIIALVVSAIGMFNTMTIALLERTEEIGIMKSIGASDSVISLIFIMESTIMGFLGGLLGIFIGWLEGIIFNGLVNLMAIYFGGQKLDLFYSPFWFVMVIAIFAAVVGLLTGIIPARRASRIDPLEALRYK